VSTFFSHIFREDVPIESLVDYGHQESFLLVLQTKKQTEWLLRYGNDVAWMLCTKQWSIVILVSFLFIHRLALVVPLELLYHNMRMRNSSQKGYLSSQWDLDSRSFSLPDNVPPPNLISP